MPLPFTARLARASSRLCFLLGGALLAVGIHRVVFGVHPKLIVVRDLPWDRVSAPLCFTFALGLAGVGALLGRRGLPPTIGPDASANNLAPGLSPILPQRAAGDVVLPRHSRSAPPPGQPNER